MRDLILKETRVYAVQNGLAALLFLFLFASEAIAYLLHAFPDVELLWRLSMMTHRWSSPIIGQTGHYIEMPYLQLAILAISVLLPLVAYSFRSWLGTASCGHIALAGLVVIASDAFHGAKIGREFASLAEILDARTLNGSMLSLLTVLVIMAVLCIINHVMFFARIGGKSN